MCGTEVEDQRHVLTCCHHKEMKAIRAKVWGTLHEFLAGVERGVVPSALEEAQLAARADPRKEKARMKRVEERAQLLKLKDLDAHCRLSREGYRLRQEFAQKRAAARAAAALA